MIPDIIAEFGQVFAFARTRWARFAEQIHPELRGVGMMILQTISRKGPITATEIGQLLDMDKAVVSRQLAKLRQLDLVDAVSSEADRRVVVLTASALGKQTLGELHAQLSEAYERRLAGWSQEDLAQLQDMLHRFNSVSPIPEPDGPAARCAAQHSESSSQP